MNIGIIGSGNVGGTLGKRWAKSGHNVVFSSRNPGSSEMKQLVQDAGATADAATVPDCLKRSEVLLLATPWPTTKDALTAAGDFGGKTLIDATNPLLADLSGLEYGTSSSGGEQVAQWATGAKVVKAFNTVGFPVMANTEFDGRKPALVFCGDDSDAKQVVAGLATELGFDPLDVGPLKQARYTEPFALLWITMALFQGYGREFAFQIIKR